MYINGYCSLLKEIILKGLHGYIKNTCVRKLASKSRSPCAVCKQLKDDKGLDVMLCKHIQFKHMSQFKVLELIQRSKVSFTD